MRFKRIAFDLISRSPSQFFRPVKPSRSGSLRSCPRSRRRCAPRPASRSGLRWSRRRSARFRAVISTLVAMSALVAAFRLVLLELEAPAAMQLWLRVTVAPSIVALSAVLLAVFAVSRLVVRAVAQPSQAALCLQQRSTSCNQLE